MLLVRSGPDAVTAPGGGSSTRLCGLSGSGLGFGAGLLATVVALSLGARQVPLLDLGLFAVIVTTVAASTTLAGALAAAAQCWCFWDGFGVNDLGRLTTDRGGWQGLVLMFSCAVLAYLASATRRRLVVRALIRAATDRTDVSVRI